MDMKTCSFCGRETPEHSRYCIHCGRALDPSSLAGGQTEPAASEGRHREELNVRVLHLMVALLLLAIVLPPWETPPDQPPEFLGFHFILSPPDVDGLGETTGVISRFLWTIELVTIAIAGFYFSWVFRKQHGQDQ